MGMIEVGRRARFQAEEALDVLLAGLRAGQEHLERHGPLQSPLAGLVHHAHAAAGDFLHQFVIPEDVGPAGALVVPALFGARVG